MHIDDPGIRDWVQRRIEPTQTRSEFDRDEQVRILTRLIEAHTFEQFIRRKFLGAKSFSLEGAESLIALMDVAIEKAAEDGVKEIVLGMAHRGRLNVLANILHKKPRDIFREFIDPSVAHADGSGRRPRSERGADPAANAPVPRRPGCPRARRRTSAADRGCGRRSSIR